jgi:leader peptidase (prepilin peptidase)/N-methyltransferase
MATVTLQIFLLLIAILLGWLCGLLVDHFCGRTGRILNLPVAAAAVTMAIWVRFAPPGHPAFISYGLGGALITLAATDLSIMRLPDLMTVPLLLCGFLFGLHTAEPTLMDRLTGALAGYGSFVAIGALYRAARKQDGLGLGDAKLMAAAGAWLGWSALPSVLLLGSVAGIAWALLRLLNARDSWRVPLPFGLPLAAAFWLVWLYGPITL